MLSYFDYLLNDSSVHRTVDEKGNTYGIQILGRGENLFFQENDNYLICQIDAYPGVIYASSIKNWEGKGKMKKEEKERILLLIEKYYKMFYNPDVLVQS